MLLCVVVPNFTLLASGERHARLLWDQMLDALDAVSPLVDDTALGTAFLDMRGVPGLPDAWIAGVHRALDGFVLPVRTAVGPNPFVARTAALILSGMVCDDVTPFLAPLPLDVLDLDPRVRERLRLLGVRTLGELATLPHGPLVRRFGPQAAVWHDRARGIDRTPFRPRAHTLAIEATVFGEGSAQSEAQIVFALRILLDRVCSDLTLLGQRCGLLSIEFELENGAFHAREVGLAQPTSQARPMLDVLRAHLENVTFDAPVVGLRVRALRLEEGGETLPLLAGHDADAQTIAVTLARLEAILGEPARRARDVPAYALEHKFAYDPYALPKMSALPSDAIAWPADRVVPQLRLLEMHEIDVRVVRGAPAFVGARIVCECAGPWRIEENWFERPIVRDEYDVALDDGSLYRIYRQGTTWYLRGAYD